MAIEETTTVLEPRALPNFVQTPLIKGVEERALAYIAGGFPIHFRGATGTGKTTMALHVASKIGRPVVMIHGDEEFSTSDLVGGEYGYRLRKVVDNFIHSVLKTEENLQKKWVDNRLTVACRYGFTLIYDEFTRSRPEANNVLLSVLQERMMDLPAAREGGESYLKVDPDFTAIFTSNPEEYAGVFRSQDALRDRMVTIDLEHFDKDTEMAIAAAKSGVSPQDAETIVNIIRGLRDSKRCEFAPTIRASIVIGKTLQIRNASVRGDDPRFVEVCQDVLASETTRAGSIDERAKIKQMVAELIGKHAGNGAALRARRR